MRRMISPVSDNQDKQNTYQTSISRYNKAIREGFFFEAIIIEYAMMEDRLRSFLYHIGLLNTRDSHKADVKRVKKSLKPIIEKHKESKENDFFSITNISGKMKIIRCILQWSEDEFNEYEDDYLAALRYQIDKHLDTDEMLNTLQGIRNWCDYRNEIVHALMNKNIASIYSELPDRAEEGMRLCRELDNQVGRIKTGNRIRRKIKLANK